MNVARLRLTRRPSYRRATVITGAAAVVLAFMSGCTGKPELNLPNDRVWESAHFRYHTRNGDDGACEAVLEQLERNFELTHAYLGFVWPIGRKVDYYKFRDNDDYLSNSECPVDSGSCADGSTIQSPDTLEEHELIHAYLAPMGRPPAFFVEGVASVLACEAPSSELVNPKQWRDVVSLPFSDRFHVYVEGEWFVGYLLFRYGPDSFLSLYENLHDASASPDQIATTFASVYGESLDTVWNAGLASSYKSRCVNLWKCSGRALQLDGSPQGFFQACDGSDNTRTFELNAETDVLMSVDSRFVYTPVSCEQEIPNKEGGGAPGAVIDSTVVPMTAGKYFMQGAGHQSATIGVRALPEKAYSQDCARIEPFELNPSEFPRGSFKLSIPNDGTSWFVKLRPPDNSFVLRTEYEGQEIQVDQCLSCSAAPECHSLVEEAQPEADGTVTLRLTSATQGSGYVTTNFRF